MKTETKKTPVKKTPVKKTTGKTYFKDGIEYNEFGICLSCNDGSLECFHTNLEETSGSIVCKNCGITIS